MSNYGAKLAFFPKIPQFSSLFVAHTQDFHYFCKEFGTKNFKKDIKNEEFRLG